MAGGTKMRFRCRRTLDLRCLDWMMMQGWRRRGRRLGWWWWCGPLCLLWATTYYYATTIVVSATEERSTLIVPPPAPAALVEEDVRRDKSRPEEAAASPSLNNDILLSNSNNKPRFVWHPGPMKTGTTTIQMGLGGMQKSGTFDQDNWEYVNQFQAGLHTNAFWPEFQQTMKQYRAQGRNVVVSNENFSVFFRPEHYQKMKELLDAEDWEVQVIIGYRPYHEWLPSHWAQTFKLHAVGGNARRKRGLKDPDVPWRNERGDNWNKCSVTPMFPDFYKKTGRGSLFADAVYDFAAPHFNNITLLHLHNPDNSSNDSLRSRFVCDILQAELACARSRTKDAQQGHGAKNARDLEGIQRHALVGQAAVRGLIDIEQWTRTQILDAVARHLNEKMAEQLHPNATVWDVLPLVCPPQADLDGLWEKTLAIEARLFPELWATASVERERTLREGFQTYVDRKTYCHVNVSAVLDDPEWQRFFATFRSSSPS